MGFVPLFFQNDEIAILHLYGINIAISVHLCKKEFFYYRSFCIDPVEFSCFKVPPAQPYLPKPAKRE
jgi:hypothetical protein